MAGDAAHPARRRIVHDAAEERRIGFVARPRQRLAALGRRDARPERLGRQKHRLLHPERLEDVPRRVPIDPLAAHALDDVAQEEEVDVAVDEPLAGPRQRDFFTCAPDRLLRTVELDVELEIGTQAGDVRQQVTDRDLGLSVPRELGDEARHRIAQPDPALLHQLHHARRRRHHFGERGEIEQGVFGHRLGRRQNRALTKRAGVQDRVSAPDENHCARKLTLRDGLVDQLTDARKSRRLGRDTAKNSDSEKQTKHC